MGQLSVDLSAKMESLKTKPVTRIRAGISFPALFYRTARTRQDPLRRSPMGNPHRLHRQR